MGKIEKKSMRFSELEDYVKINPKLTCKEKEGRRVTGYPSTVKIPQRIQLHTVGRPGDQTSKGTEKTVKATRAENSKITSISQTKKWESQGMPRNVQNVCT